jgi:Pyruvate/2-oxoacid:ferredoxin oxidoreductase delta subunit/coenzyme F420-reducing hydrogenase delta subunit
VRALGELPTSGAAQIAEVDAAKCAFCYTCRRACPHGSPEPDEAAQAMKIDAVRCVGCGICAAICPANAIRLVSADGAPAREEAKKTGRLLALCCENSAALAAREAFSGLDVTVETVPCGGSVNEAKLAAALSSYDRVLVAVCVQEACRHFDGNRRAHLQEERLKRMLEGLGLDPSRAGYVEVSHAMPKPLRQVAERLLYAPEEGKA